MSHLSTESLGPDARSEARRQRLWDGARGAHSWRGLLLGPEPEGAQEKPGLEYAINLRYWRRLWRISVIGLNDRTALCLRAAIVLCALFTAWVSANISIVLGGTISSHTLAYLKFLSPHSSTTEMVNAAHVPEHVKDRCAELVR